MLQMFCLMCAFVTGIQRTSREESCILSWVRTMNIYRNGFLGLIEFMYERRVITLKEKNELKDYVLNDGYLDSDSSEYQEILETIKNSK